MEIRFLGKVLEQLIMAFVLTLCMVGQSREKSFEEEKLNPVESETLFQNVAGALEKAAAFYLKEYDKVNLDSIFGLRVCQGFLHKAIELSETNAANEMRLKRVKILHSSIARIAENGYKELQASKTDYFHRFKFLIHDPWFYMMPYQSFDTSLIPQSDVLQDDSLDESVSDLCMTDLVGNKESSAQMTCVITNHCWEIMSEKSKKGYHLTHQALFIMLAEKSGCRSKILDKLGSPEEWNKHMRYLGSNVFHQMERRYKQGFSSRDGDKDLFAEQIVICQMLGIVECFNSKYLNLLISWQDVTGCWKEREKKREHQNAQEGNLAQIGGVFQESNDGETLRRLSPRRLTEEKILSDGCASHFTGVATGALGLFTYWYLHPPGNQSFGTQSGHFDGAAFKESIAAIFFDIRWPVVFVFVSLLVYFCRKWTRTHISRRYTKLTI